MHNAEHESDPMSNDSPQTEVIPYMSELVLPPREPAELAPVQHACPNLSSAIALAREKCRIASKDKKNEFHKYSYASADEVINTAKEALVGSGLAIIPQLQEMTVVGAGNMAFHALNRTIFLSHSSGEFVPLTVRGWPVVVERGKTLDKAFATALTGSMAYLLRDLLQMPRGDEHDMNARNDTQQQQPTKTDPKEIMRRLAKAIEEAESMDDLRTAFNEAMKNKAITAADKQALNKLKEERKAALTPAAPPASGTPGDPDADPFASGEATAAERKAEQKKKLAATK